jgi:hypothetical protein
MRLSSIFTWLLFAAAAMAASPVPTGEKPFAFGSVRFEENRGQTDASVRYLARARGQRVFFTSTGVVFAAPGGAAVTMRFEGAAESRWEASGAAGDTISYYIGNDSAKWVKGAPLFDRVVWRNAYPGIDIAFHGDGERLEYDLLLAPGADASKVRVRFDRPAKAHIHADGTVEIAAAGNAILQHAPQIWQETGGGERREVNGKFLADGANGLRLSLAAYERSKALIVDPVLEFGSYFGGENDDEIVAIADGVIAGNTRSITFPGTLPALRTSRDVFVHGTGLVVPGQSNNRNTFSGTIIIGGSGDDQIAGVAANSVQPGFFIAGTTTSTDFPVLGGLIAGGSQTYHGGASDGFIGFIELYSGVQSYASYGLSNYIGGSGADRINAFTGNGEVFAYAGVTDSPDLPTFNASQTTLAGGKDAFYGVYSFGFSSVVYGYLGGSGDDAAYAVAIQGSTPTVWIGGSSASSDFPFVNGALSGPSDGFLATVTGSPSFFSAAPQVTVTAYRVGGSGDDSVRALVATPYAAPFSYNNPNTYSTGAVTGIGFAGTTTSPDLPVLNAAQPQFGGASDGFVGMWNSASAAPGWLTYAGGSGADQFNAIAQNWAGDLYVGGSTSSADLPVVNALQPANAGGQDAMFAVYDYTGALQQLTYFGGSGDDKIEGMWMDYNYVARMVGSTSSTDLPEYGASQGPGGGLDGFIANIGSDYLIGPASLIMPKDGLFNFSVRAARTEFRQPVTYQSADPSRVRLVYFGQSFDQVSAAADDNIGVEALADSGEVDITVTSPGFSTKTIHVNLYPGAFAALFGAGATTLSTWAQPVYLSYYYCAIDPASGAILGVCMGLRSGAPAPVVNWTSTDPTVAQIIASNGGSTLQAVAPGTVTLTFSVDGYNVIQSSQTVNVAAPAPAPPANGVALGKDLTAGIPTTFSVNGAAVSTGYHGTFTARSGDPSRLLLATDGTTPGSSQVTVTMQNGAPLIYAQALTDSGTVQVFFSSDQFSGEIALNVNLEPAVLRWGVFSATGPGYAASIPLTAGRSTTLQYSLQGVSGGAGALRPGAAPLTLTLSNTNPTIVELNRLTVVTGSSNSYTLNPLAAGSTTLTLTDSNPDMPVMPASLPVSVQPTTVTVSLPALPAYVNVGNGLQASVSFIYSGGASTQTIPVSVDDPSVATVSSSATVPGTNQLTLQAGAANINYTIYVQGQGSSGTTNLHVQFPQGTQTIPVKLFPAGAGFSSAFGNSSIQGYSLQAQVAAYYLDPNTGIGIVAQTPGPGPGITVDFSADGPVQFYHSSAVLTAANPNANVNITAPPAGQQVDVTVTTEGGASVSPITASEKAGTLAPSGPVILAQLTLAQGEFRQYTLSSGPLPATVTSSDPQNVLVSASATDPGSPSIQLAAGASSIYIHAVGITGVYTVEFDSPMAAVPSLIQVGLLPLQLNIYSTNTVVAGASANYQTSLNATALAPGVGPFHFTVQTSDPTIATVTPTAFDVGGNSAYPGQFTVTGVSAGTAQLTVTGPSGVYVSPASFAVTVGAPAPAPTYTLGVNLQGTAQIDLGAGFANANGAIVTLTSSDPTILLLSRSATTVGAASVVIAVPAGTHVTQAIYLQALAQGTVTLQVTAGAPVAVAANVVVQPSWVSCGSKPISLAAGTSQTFYCLATYSGSAAGLTTVAQFQSVGPRAGLSNLTIGLASSAPNVFTVTPATQTLAATSTGTTLRGIAAGTGTFQVTAPPGFGPSPDGSEAVPVTVTPATFAMACSPEIVLGQDTQITCAISGSPAAVTATSTNPSLLLVSANANTAGAATASSGGSPSFTIQALAGAGTAEVVFSASGYQDVRIAVALRPSQFTVTLPYSSQQEFTLQSGNSLALSVEMLLGGYGNVATPRAGLTIPLDLSVDNSNVVSLTPAHLNFTNAQGSGNFTVKALAPGSTLLRLSAPASYQVTGTPVAISVTQ